VQIFMNGELFIVQKFGRRDWALEWAMGSGGELHRVER
jgi:hypothetical protein